MINPRQRIVVSMPLTTIWNHDGDIVAERIRDLGVDDIKSLLRQGSVQFVIANVGSALEWIHPDRSFDFWRNVAKERIVSPNANEFRLEDFPGQYGYRATLWTTNDAGDIILLEMLH